ncbi:MAG: BamA/TamA family outer membrane protein [Bacteroidia bacterium]
MGEKDILLKKVFVVCENPDIDKNDMYGYIKQKPNRKLLGVNLSNKKILKTGSGFPLYLHLYNLVNPQREKKRAERRDRKFIEKNKRRQAKNKPEKSRKKKTIGEILYNIGEPPVILDSTKTRKSRQQLEQYLNNKGYFVSVVTDSVYYPKLQKKKKKKAKLYYYIKPTVPYTVDSVVWQIEDPGVAYDLMPDTSAFKCLIKQGANFDVDILELERQRITKSLRNNGYYKFSKNFIHYEVDTTGRNRHAKITIVITKPVFQISDTSFYESSHQRYQIRNIRVVNIYDFRILRNDSVPYYDTVFAGGIAFLRDTFWEHKLRYKPDLFFSRITFQTNKYFSDRDVDTTYRMISALRVSRQVIIEQHEVGNNFLDVDIKMFPFPKEAFTAQIEGTNTGGNLGIGGSFSFQNKNVFRGAELFEFRIKGGTEAQQPLTDATTTTQDQITFNTIEAGSEVSLNVPRAFFPFNLLPIKKAEERKTMFLGSFNYQSRLDYDRILGNLSYGYSFKKGRYSRFSIYPVEINIVKVNPKAGLAALLENRDPLLQYRFTDHLINDFRLNWTINTQTISKKKNIDYLKIDLESSGNLVRTYYEMKGWIPDANGSYRIAGIPFSQYVRLNMDYIHYWNLSDYQQLVIRVSNGVGYPLKNFPTMPLEKSFFGGGANGIRAWEARSLGPGSYQIPADQKYAQFGDIQMQYNVEVRFKISKSWNGALFADGGNIWLIKPDSNRVGGDFQPGKFLDDFAFGPGVGLRYDLSFFIIRLDWAFKLRDPAQPFGSRWYVPGRRPLESNLNFGIGYPF